MAGGTWTVQNKVRPGVYINFVSDGGPLGAPGSRGIMTMALPLSWGPSKQVLEINAGNDVSTLLGYDLTDPQLLLVKESMKRASKLLLYRLNTGTKAAVTVGPLTATAKHGGLRGNDLSVVIQTNVDDNTKSDVRVLLKGAAVWNATVTNIAALVALPANDWVVFTGTGAFTTTAGAPLVGGADGTVTNQDHTDYLGSVEVFDFNTIAYAGTDATLKSVYTAFVKRLRDSEGQKVQAVLENYPTADYEGVISVKNGVVLSDGTSLTAAQAVAWVAAATAAAEMNESLTYSAYDDAVDVSTRYTNSQIVAALLAGEMVFVQNKGRAVIEQDINTLTSFTPTKGKQFSKNRVIRVLDGIGNDLQRIFESSYIGKVNNNADGRALFWGECANYLNTLQEISAIQNFDSQADVVVKQGSDSDSVVAELKIQPVDSIEKIYMTVEVR